MERKWDSYESHRPGGGGGKDATPAEVSRGAGLFSVQRCQCGLHFGACVLVTCALSHGDARLQGGPRFFVASTLGEKLGVLEVSGDVPGMGSQERFEIVICRGDIPGIGAFHRQAVACEGIRRLRGDEIFQDLAARFLLWLGQSHAHSIFALPLNDKSSLGF